MKLSSIANGYRRVLVVVFLFVMAALLAFIGVIVTNNSNKEYKEAQATIVEITSEYIGDDLTHDVYVDYEVDGVQYSHIVYRGNYDSSFAEGQTITILYEVGNPGVTGTDNPAWLKYVLFAGAGVFLVAAIAAIVILVRSSAQAKAIEQAPLVEEDRQIGEPQKLYFSTDPHTHVKLRFYIEDEQKNVLYEGKMTKHGLFVPHTYLFTDNIRHTETEHKVGLVNSAEVDGWKVSQGFTFDGVDIARYFEANKITVNYSLEGKGFRLSIYHNGQHIADAVTSSRYVHEEDAEQHKVEASLLRFNNYYFRIEGQTSYIDVIFLVLLKEALSPRAESLL